MKLEPPFRNGRIARLSGEFGLRFLRRRWRIWRSSRIRERPSDSDARNLYQHSASGRSRSIGSTYFSGRSSNKPGRHGVDAFCSARKTPTSALTPPFAELIRLRAGNVWWGSVGLAEEKIRRRRGSFFAISGHQITPLGPRPFDRGEAPSPRFRSRCSPPPRCSRLSEGDCPYTCRRRHLGAVASGPLERNHRLDGILPSRFNDPRGSRRGRRWWKGPGVFPSIDNAAQGFAQCLSGTRLRQPGHDQGVLVACDGADAFTHPVHQLLP